MIFYGIVRMCAWLWGFPWPLQNAEGRAVCAVISATEVLAGLAYVAMVCADIYERRKNGGAK